VPVNQVSYEAALRDIDDTILCDNIRLKKFQSQVKKKCFQTKKLTICYWFFCQKINNIKYYKILYVIPIIWIFK